jgi:hypothetical protein
MESEESSDSIAGIDLRSFMEFSREQLDDSTPYRSAFGPYQDDLRKLVEDLAAGKRGAKRVYGLLCSFLVKKRLTVSDEEP